MNWKNRITDLFKTDYPIIQAPMFGVTTNQMAASASESGILGSLALADLSPEQCREAIRQTKTLTRKPFVANIFVNEIPAITPQLQHQYNYVRLFLRELAHQYQLQVNFPDINDIKITDYHDQIDAILDEGCRLISFTFGNTDQASIDKVHQKNGILMGTCTSVDEARLLEQSGIDVICFQGIEAGGHRGSFLDDGTTERNGQTEFAKIKETIKVPLIYAGGIYNTADLLKTKKAGADGFQIGSLFLNTPESALLNFEKDTLNARKTDSTTLTKSFSGRFARGLKNKFTDLLQDNSLVLPYPYQNKITGPLRKAAKAAGHVELINLWTGRNILTYPTGPVKEIIEKLVSEVESLS